MNKGICILGFIDKDKRKKIGYYLFFAGIMLELLVMVTDNVANFTIPYRGRITHVAFVLFCIKILLTEYRLKEWLVMGVLGLLSAISYLTCGDEYIIRIVVILFAANCVEISKIIKCILVTTVAASIVTIVLSFWGISGQLFETRNYGRGLVETRFMMGFSHANNLHDVVWYIFSLIVLVYKKRITNREYLAMLVANIILFSLTRSRTGFITIILLISLSYMVKHSDHCKKKDIRLLAIISFAIEMISIIGITIHASGHNIYNSQIVAILDVPLTSRLEMLSEYANIAYWEWLPGPRSAENVDNGFAVINYSYGMLISILVVLVIIWLFVRLIKREDYFSIILLICSILVLFMEATFMINVSLLCNFIVILAIESMSSSRKTENVV